MASYNYCLTDYYDGLYIAGYGFIYDDVTFDCNDANNSNHFFSGEKIPLKQGSIMKSILLVFLGGGLGSICRYGISKWLAGTNNFSFIGTLTSNALASLLLGYLMAMAFRETLDGDLRLLAAVGFCGGFSTFSTFSWEIFSLFQEGKSNLGFAYMLTSVVVGIAFIWVGYNLKSWIF